MTDQKMSLLKTFANYGAAGLFGGWLLIYSLPQATKTFSETLDKQAEIHRAERKESREHGSEAARELGSAIKSLNDTFREVQAKTQANQERLIEIQLKKLEAKE